MYGFVYYSITVHYSFVLANIMRFITHTQANTTIHAHVIDSHFACTVVVVVVVIVVVVVGRSL